MNLAALYLAIGLMFVVGAFLAAKDFDAQEHFPLLTWLLVVLGWPFFCGYVMVYAVSRGDQRGGGPEQ